MDYGAATPDPRDAAALTEVHRRVRLTGHRQACRGESARGSFFPPFFPVVVQLGRLQRRGGFEWGGED